MLIKIELGIRLRARLGAEIDLEDGFTAGLRLATGQDDQPVSQNQSLGAANSAQGGNFSKYAVWLDRAFIKYELGGSPTKDLAISIGRFDNPFFSTSIIWYDDLAFDGLGGARKKGSCRGRDTISLPLALFRSSIRTSIFPRIVLRNIPVRTNGFMQGRWGVIGKSTTISVSKGPARFIILITSKGRLSNPFVPLTAQDQGNTDDTRPAFAQYGNTYMPLRDITPTAANDFGTINQWQYFGLATPFRDVAFTARLDYKHFEPFIISLTGEFVKNMAFDQGRINAIAVNNRGPGLASGALGPFVGGDTAWIAGINLGSVALQKRWDWNVGLDYRYVESDAVIDGFCEPDFGGGGTNVKGYTIRAALALAPKIWLQARWYSSDQVAGPTLKADTFMFDVNAKF